jgi:hypothetical protein
VNNGKAASPHTGIPNELLKYGGRSMAKLLMPLFTAVWGAAALPHTWTTGVIQYFHKAGEPSSMGNYRGITLLDDVVSKLFHKVLANRLVKHAASNGPAAHGPECLPAMCTASVRPSKAGSAVGSQRTHSSWISARRMIQCGGMPSPPLGCCISCGIRASGGRSGGTYAPCTPVLPARSDVVTPRLAEVHVDLGTAQGDTLSCVLFDLFIDDLVQAVDTACAGVPLPVPDDADALLARRLVALLFSDDFNALADEPQALQQAVDATHGYMVLQVAHESQMNVGPNKSAVMLFAPQTAD